MEIENIIRLLLVINYLYKRLAVRNKDDSLMMIGESELF